MDEEFITSLPLYTNAYKAWDAATKGYTVDEILKLQDAYSEYTKEEQAIKELKEKLDSMPEGTEKGKLQSDIEKREYEMLQKTIEATKDNAEVLKNQAGLTQKQLERIKVKRQEYLQERDKLLGYIANGLMKEDLKTPAVSLDELKKMRMAEKEVLIYDVASEPENGIPLGFINQVGAITQILPSMINTDSSTE